MLLWMNIKVNNKFLKKKILQSLSQQAILQYIMANSYLYPKEILEKHFTK